MPTPWQAGNHPSMKSAFEVGTEVARRTLRLDWKAPSRALPHGVSGIASIIGGAGLIILPALLGNLDPVANRIVPLALYALTGFANAVAGFAISRRAPQKYRFAFRVCSAFQCSLIYFVWRFSPTFPAGGTWMAAAADLLVCMVLALGIVAFAGIALVRLPLLVGGPVTVGAAALMLLAGYPLQLALLGEDWWRCVQGQYPQQGAAMVAYIYVPASWAFGLMLFGATLWSRKIVGDLGLGGGFATGVLTVLVGTVLMQEVHFPEPASTQKLWLPCPAPPAGSWSAWVERNLDTSAIARTALKKLGVR